MSTLLFFHSLFRWLILASLGYAIFRAFRGSRSRRPFTHTDNAIRYWTATIAHVQLVIGIVLYSQSPVVKAFFASSGASRSWDLLFFGGIHIGMMLLAVVLITIGSSLAKRKLADQEKFGTMLRWFSISLVIIFIAIPWPFSPLAHRPYLRSW